MSRPVAPAGGLLLITDITSTHKPSFLRRVFDLAPTLKEAELRVLLAMAADAEASGQNATTVSIRSLAKACKISTSAVRRAVDSLVARRLIWKRAGTTSEASGFGLTFLETVVFAPVQKQGGVALRATPLGLFEPQASQVDLGLLQLQGVATGATPSAEIEGVAASTGAVDFEGVSGELAGIDPRPQYVENAMDRVFAARPSNFRADALANARRWLHGYMCKLGSVDVLKHGEPHPPDDQIVAQFLACGESLGGWPRLEGLLIDLVHERKTVSKYAWFVSVALQRLHGVAAPLVKARREQLRLVKRQGVSEASAELDQLQLGIARAALSKVLK